MTCQSPSADDVRTLASLISEAKHCVFCTGAGISTNAPAALRDYRGPNGIWTEAQSKGLVDGEPGDRANVRRGVDCPWDDAMYSMMPAAQPTFAHRAIAALVAAGVVKHVISQNEDGLHRRSGVPAQQLSEMHGNAFIELCGRYASDSDSDLDSSSSSCSSDDEEGAAVRAADEATKLAARQRRPAGCGAAVVREWVTYYKDTYKRSNPNGRHVTGRRCPQCNGRISEPPRSMEGGGELDGKEGEGEAVGEAEGAEGAEGAEEAVEAAHGGGRQCPGLRGRGWLLDSTVDFGKAPVHTHAPIHTCTYTHMRMAPRLHRRPQVTLLEASRGVHACARVHACVYVHR